MCFLSSIYFLPLYTPFLYTTSTIITFYIFPNYLQIPRLSSNSSIYNSSLSSFLLLYLFLFIVVISWLQLHSFTILLFSSFPSLILYCFPLFPIFPFRTFYPFWIFFTLFLIWQSSIFLLIHFLHFILMFS